MRRDSGGGFHADRFCNNRCRRQKQSQAKTENKESLKIHMGLAY